jgi:hypothetical protein
MRIVIGLLLVASLNCGDRKGIAVATPDASGDAAAAPAADGGAPITADSGADATADAGATATADVGADATADAGAMADGAPADRPAPDANADVRPGISCSRPADCEALPRPASTHWCQAAWSCLDNRCSWECASGRTCERDTAGCLTCSDDPAARHCPGDRCLVSAPAERVEFSSCPMVPDRSTWTCFGMFARLPDGTLCSLAGLPTGAYRYTVSCNGCQTVFVH